jgi:hypothetical protein
LDIHEEEGREKEKEKEKVREGKKQRVLGLIHNLAKDPHMLPHHSLPPL